MSNQCAIFTDCHFGIKKSNDLFLKSQMKFFENVFIPYLQKNNIKNLFFLGDLFDNRVTLNIRMKNIVLDLFDNLLKDYQIYLLVGNHDSAYTNTISVNSLKFLNKLNNVTVIDRNYILELENNKILLVPWIVDDVVFLSELKNMKQKIDICMGHFAINGFRLNKFKIEEGGLQRESFFKFRKVFSGHLHTRGVQNYDGCEMVYVGSPYQLTRADADEPRGFCVLDLDTLEHKFIDNKVSIQYIQLNYPDKFTRKMIEGNIIDVNVKFDKDIDDLSVQTYIKHLESYNPIVPPVINPINSFISPDNVTSFEIKSTSDLIKEYINALDINNKDEIYVSLEKLYEEAKNTL